MTVLRQELNIDNVENGEIIHQHCLLISGQCKVFDNSEEDFIAIKVIDAFSQAAPYQNWPIVSGKWKALVMLSPGLNQLEVTQYHRGESSAPLKTSVTYQPLLQLPPLHLAILVARDSPLLIDCPPAKRGAISTAHSTLESAIVKLRMAAYMWQALTAEDLRVKGLGRRAFRLEEAWGSDTTTREGIMAQTAGSGTASAAASSSSSSLSPCTATARVHVVRSERTVAELRDAQCAQQNPRGSRRDDLHRYFEEALAAHGTPFLACERPVVAGLILDAHYAAEQRLIVGHAALGCHRRDGVSLGVFGSHTTYSWPRFLEEVPACLLDAAPTGDSVGNDNGECGTMREACFVGQGAFLHEVGHAFGADHTTGIMARGYSKDWPCNFIAHSEESHDAKWDLEDALKFRMQPHFMIPGDKTMSDEERDAAADIRCTMGQDQQPVLELSSASGIAQIELQRDGHESVVVYNFRSSFKASECYIQNAKFNGTNFSVSFSDLESQIDRSAGGNLGISILGMNGKTRACANVWALLADLPYIRIPGHSTVLHRRSVKSDALDARHDQHVTDAEYQYHRWTVLLKRAQPGGGGYDPVSEIDLRVGCTMDGAVVRYASGAEVNCGPVRDRSGHPHTFGGHASQKRAIPVGARIAQVELNRRESGWGSLDGIRITLDDGTRWGELNSRSGRRGGGGGGGGGIEVLKPRDDEEVIGFYGRSERDSGFTYEFGIITAEKGEELPDVVYHMPELQNIQDEHEQYNGRQHNDDEMDEDNDYDHEQDDEDDEDDGDEEDEEDADED